MLKYFLLLTVLAAGIFSVKAQINISGRVTDANGAPVGFANVSVHAVADSAIIKSMQSDSAGHFLLTNLRSGIYLLRISFIGYRIYSQQLKLSESTVIAQLGAIILTPDPRQLSEVMVSGERSAIRYEPMKTILQVTGNSFFKSSVNATDILRKAPGVTVGPDGMILVSGQNPPAIFINGKPVPMSAEESLAYMNGLTPDQIADIEIISNPSSMYDGQYKAIIDIRLKRDASMGWKGTASTAIRQNVYTSTDNSLSLSRRSANATYTLRGGYVLGNDFYRYAALQQLANTNYMATATPTRTANNNLSLQLGADYTLGKNQNLELSVKTHQANRDMYAYNTLTFSEALQNNLLAIRQTTTRSDPTQRNYGLNAAYMLRFSKNSGLNVLGNLSNIRNRQTEDIQIRDQLANQLSSYWKTTLKNNIRIWNLQADYNHTVQKNLWEAGGKFAHITTNNNLRYDTLSSNQIFVPDASRTNNFVYDEYISAGYISYNYKGPQLNVNLSIRTEYTHTSANAITQNELRKRDYFTWLPAASAFYQLTSDQRIGLSFSRRMTRPDFNQLNPFRFYLSPLNYRVGNPYLRPSVISSFNITYNYHDLSIGIMAGREKDMMTRYPEYNRITNELLYLGTNLPYSDFANMESSYTFALFKWWKLAHSLGVYYNKQQMPYLGQTYAIGVTNYIINGSQVFTLPKGYTADLTYRYLSASGNSLYIQKASGTVDMGFQKGWNQGKLNTKLNFYDLFYTHVNSLEFRAKQLIDNRFSHRWATCRVVLTLAYNFGSANYKIKQNTRSEEEGRASQ